MSLSTRIDDSLHCKFIYVAANEARLSCHMQVCSSMFVPNVMNCKLKLVISVYICIPCIVLNKILLCTCIYNMRTTHCRYTYVPQYHIHLPV